MFNLPAPPLFQGFDPHKPVTFYERHLPHWRQEGATYFVTFRLADSLPQSKLNYLVCLREEWNRKHPPPQNEQLIEAHFRQVFQQVETWLDEGYGACNFRNQKLAAILAECLLHYQAIRYHVFCWSIMPNHCHLVIQPFQEWALETILQGIKGISALKVNRLIDSKGNLWQDESYDRIVRDEEHLWRIIQYIGRNPRRAGLPQDQWQRWLDPSWESVGWRFVDDS